MLGYVMAGPAWSSSREEGQLNESRVHVIYSVWINILLISCVCAFSALTISWASGKASSLQNLSDGVLVWLSVCSEMHIVCMWSS